MNNVESVFCIYYDVNFCDVVMAVGSRFQVMLVVFIGSIRNYDLLSNCVWVVFGFGYKIFVMIAPSIILDVDFSKLMMIFI